jgi:hypothetical protein
MQVSGTISPQASCRKREAFSKNESVWDKPCIRLSVLKDQVISQDREMITPVGFLGFLGSSNHLPIDAEFSRQSDYL